MKPIDNSYILKDGSTIAVIGGGPTGSFFSIFALKMAEMIDKKINVIIFDPKNFTQYGPSGCNRCGGVISEILVQTLAIEGIQLPASVIQKGINSYRLHTEKGSAFIATPSMENTIATVYRGGGPLGLAGKEKESFDNFLLEQAIKEGAVHESVKIAHVEYQNGRPCLYAKNREPLTADLVVGAFGVNSSTPTFIDDSQMEYMKPKMVTTAIAEIGLDKEFIAEHIGQSIHLFLLPMKNIKFAAIIPKGTYLTVCILGKEIDNNTVNEFLNHPVLKSLFPKSTELKLSCRCLPKMNVAAPKVGFANRMVFCGDAGSTRLFKDGLGAAYIMGKAAAITSVYQGVSREHFRKYYYPIYKSLITDNSYGKILFQVTDLFKKHGLLTQAMLRVVEEEQTHKNHAKVMSKALWNMFTGNERYKNIFYSTFDLPVHIDLWTAIRKTFLRRHL